MVPLEPSNAITTQTEFPKVDCELAADETTVFSESGQTGHLNGHGGFCVRADVNTLSVEHKNNGCALVNYEQENTFRYSEIA